jgi:hypothetical protein
VPPSRNQQGTGKPPRGWPWSWFNPRRITTASGVPEGVVLAMALFEDILNVMSRLLKQHQNRSPIYKHITPGLTDYGWFGGSAGYLEDEAGYAVAVESGSSLQVHFALARLMAEPSTFPSLKSVRQADLARPLGLPLLSRPGEAEFRSIGHPNLKSPSLGEDPKLHGNLRIMHSHALTYLFLHEISHVVQGHIEYCSDAKYRALQVPPGEYEDFMKNEIQPLEFLADQHALGFGAVQIITSVWGNPALTQKRASAIEHLTLYGIAAGIVSLLFEQYSGQSYSHPPASHRAMYIRASGHMKIPDLDLSRDEIRQALHAGMEQAIHAWDALGWPRSQDLPGDVDTFLDRIWKIDSRCIRPERPPPLKSRAKTVLRKGRACYKPRS